MSEERFLEFLQQLLTMAESGDQELVELARTALMSVVQLALKSGKVGQKTRQLMILAVDRFELMIIHAADFAGKPGEVYDNQKKRRRLLQMLRAGC